ncbi:Sjogren's syndrome/scleroderma autoantigen 1 family protein [Halobellus rufus]|uniref:Sjogren's syndrome/scleroderma autoantigen 1 family protein n=1 Tax=Halobellus rufus TaxID=1448860 RepID=UPI0006785C81|nr:Sjogren's syndrome/scleroderma autoantigen 1 family protein [Halobellus rufus]
MSDFDEEAERERLREKYERDEERRKETQQMSELLLKGATMTNRHCNDCGSPIFRYQGQEFCPSCQRVTGESDAGAQGDDGQVEAGEESAADQRSTADQQPTADQQSTPGRQPSPEARAGADEPGRSAEDVASGVDVADDGAEPPSVRDARPSTTPETEAAPVDGRGAREALLGALTRHARLAEETDDPRRAKEHLSAAREAAAALDELD